jgi:hypothetical protein
MGGVTRLTVALAVIMIEVWTGVDCGWMGCGRV